MGWSNEFPNPFIVGGGGVSGQIIILDTNGDVLATLGSGGIDVISPGFPGQHIVLGRDPNTNAPGLFIYNGIDPDPSFLRVGTGSPNRITLGTPDSSVDLGQSFVTVTTSSIGDNPKIQLDDSGIAGVPKIGLIPDSAQTFGLYMHASERWSELGFQGAQSGAVVGCVDGKVVSTLTDTVNSSVGTEVTVSTANCQNVPQITGHAYRALVMVSLTGATAGNRARYRLWDGAVGFVQLGANAPIIKVAATTTQFDDILLCFLWRASSTQTISNVNLGMEFFSGTTSVTTRITTGSYAFTIDDIGPANRISGL